MVGCYRNLQSWINRVNLALDLQSEKMKVGVSDIRDWLNTAKPEVGKMYFLDDNYECDSDYFHRRCGILDAKK